MIGECSTRGRNEKLYKIQVEKPEEKRTFEMSTRRRKDKTTKATEITTMRI
jgi:hypothetical protein